MKFVLQLIFNEFEKTISIIVTLSNLSSYKQADHILTCTFWIFDGSNADTTYC